MIGGSGTANALRDPLDCLILTMEERSTSKTLLISFFTVTAALQLFSLQLFLKHADVPSNRTSGWNKHSIFIIPPIIKYGEIALLFVVTMTKGYILRILCLSDLSAKLQSVWSR